MTNAEENQNTEPHNSAGNRIDRPVGNPATRRIRPGQGASQPGGPPTSVTSRAAVLASSEVLAGAEASTAQGAAGTGAKFRENREADPANQVLEGSYGGNFGNGTQNSYRDQNRRENQDSDANRGEFGTQNSGGTTHGSFSNQNRPANYEPNSTTGGGHYGGPGRAGEQDNAYRRYNGRNERPDSRTGDGFEPGATARPAATDSHAPENDNGSPRGMDSGYAADYGHTSLRFADTVGQHAGVRPEPDYRNQTEDYRPAQSSTDSRGRHEAAVDAANQLAVAGSPNTGDERNGYTPLAANKGDSVQGIGSRGGSYNEAYDDSRPGSTAGSPAKGDQRTEDLARNYGPAARRENRPGDDDSPDHGAPQRNAGRDGEADE